MRGTIVGARHVRVLLALAGVGATMAAASSTAVAAVPTCAGGTREAPVTLTGTYNSNVVVEGNCALNGGPVVIRGNLTIKEGASLSGLYGMNHLPSGGPAPRLTVYGNVLVKPGAALDIGCEPVFQKCSDDPQTGEEEPGTLASRERIYGNLTATGSFLVVVHATRVAGDVSERGGGPGLDGCSAYSDFEDMQIAGNIAVTGLESCWLGFARDRVAGNMTVANDQLSDPDAIEILANRIGGNLACRGNKSVWDSVESGPEGFPRIPQPNKVGGRRSGQCVYESATTLEQYEKGELGTEPF
jgi:hypothetical protein